MKSILVIADVIRGSVDDATKELATAARSAVKAGDGEWAVGCAVLGQHVADAASNVADWFDAVHVFDHPLLAMPDGEAYGSVLHPFIKRTEPALVLLAHTNNAMDLAPALSVRLNRPLVTDCLSLSFDDGGLVAVRPAYAGKVHARVVAGPSLNGYIATVRPGSYRMPNEPQADGRILHEAVEADIAIRRRSLRSVEPEAEEVDISQSERLVSVGRGIEDGDNLEMIESLARALGAEVACSRPVVDKHWLPKSRQVGTSGVTVKPKLYLAVGISGSFQHMGGVKGNPFIVAINKDSAAPIFGVADVGVVGDLFDIVPVLTERLNALRS